MKNTEFSRIANVHQPAKKPFFARINLDIWLCLWLLVFAFVGLTVLYSANGMNQAMIIKQAIHLGIGWFVMLFIAQTNPRLWLFLIPLVYLFSIGLLIAVYFIGTEIKGAQRWILLPVLGQFQPSELARIALPIAVAGFLSYRDIPPKWSTIIIASAIIAIPFLLILNQPDLGTSIMIALSGLYCIFFAGLSWKIIFSTIALLAPLAIFMFFFVLKEYQQQRVLTLLNPESDRLGSGWNIWQSKTAIGSGGIDGKGWLNGTQSHLDFLPESHTDFIFAVIAEEFGIIGIIVLLLLYFFLLSRCLYIAFTATNTFLRILGSALTMMIFTYIVVNIAMVSGVFPVVGVPLPLISYGGTSLVTMYISFGILMRISTHHKY